MAYCYKCGKPLIDGDRFCTHCGTEQYTQGNYRVDTNRISNSKAKKENSEQRLWEIIKNDINQRNFISNIGFYGSTLYSVGVIVFGYTVLNTHSNISYTPYSEAKTIYGGALILGAILLLFLSYCFITNKLKHVISCALFMNILMYAINSKFNGYFGIDFIIDIPYLIGCALYLLPYKERMNYKYINSLSTPWMLLFVLSIILSIIALIIL